MGAILALVEVKIRLQSFSYLFDTYLSLPPLTDNLFRVTGRAMVLQIEPLGLLVCYPLSAKNKKSV